MRDVVSDVSGRSIYLTDERWQHICDEHPEMDSYRDMDPIRITYDPEGDILYVTFGAPTPATGYQVCDQILLRVDPDSHQAAGLTIFNFSVHARSRTPIVLSGLKGERPAPVDLVSLLSSPPVNRFLRLFEDEKGLSVAILQPVLGEAVAA